MQTQILGPPRPVASFSSRRAAPIPLRGLPSTRIRHAASVCQRTTLNPNENECGIEENLCADGGYPSNSENPPLTPQTRADENTELLGLRQIISALGLALWTIKIAADVGGVGVQECKCRMDKVLEDLYEISASITFQTPYAEFQPLFREPFNLSDSSLRMAGSVEAIANTDVITGFADPRVSRCSPTLSIPRSQ
jgi:hypothetical protein